MAIYRTLNDALKEIELYLRLKTFEEEALREALLFVLHNKNNDTIYRGLPENPSDLCDELKKYKDVLIGLEKKKVLQKEQLAILLPVKYGNSNEVFSQQLDIKQIAILIRNCTNLPAPKGEWSKEPADDDNSVAALVLKADKWINELEHNIPAKNMPKTLFAKTWDLGRSILVKLNFHYDDSKLKDIPLDPRRESVLKSIMPSLRKLCSELSIVNSNLEKDCVHSKVMEDNLNDLTNQVAVLDQEVNLLIQNQYQSNAGEKVFESVFL